MISNVSGICSETAFFWQFFMFYVLCKVVGYFNDITVAPDENHESTSITLQKMTTPSAVRIYVLDLDNTLLHSLESKKLLLENKESPENLAFLAEKNIHYIGSHFLRFRRSLISALWALKETGLIMVYSNASSLYGTDVCSIIDPNHELFEWDGGMVFTSADVAKQTDEREPKSLQKLLSQYISKHHELITKNLSIVILDDRIDVWNKNDQKYVFQVNAFVEWYLYCFDKTVHNEILFPRRSQLILSHSFWKASDIELDCQCHDREKLPSYMVMYSEMYDFIFNPDNREFDDKDEDRLNYLYSCVHDVRVLFPCHDGYLGSQLVNFQAFCDSLSRMDLPIYDWSSAHLQMHQKFKEIVESKEMKDDNRNDVKHTISCPDPPLFKPLKSREIHSPLQLPGMAKFHLEFSKTKTFIKNIIV